MTASCAKTEPEPTPTVGTSTSTTTSTSTAATTTPTTGTTDGTSANTTIPDDESSSFNVATAYAAALDGESAGNPPPLTEGESDSEAGDGE